MRAFTSTRWIASTRPTKSSVLVTGLRSAVTTPTGMAAGAAPTEHSAGDEIPHTANNMQASLRIAASSLSAANDFDITCRVRLSWIKAR